MVAVCLAAAASGASLSIDAVNTGLGPDLAPPHPPPPATGTHDLKNLTGTETDGANVQYLAGPAPITNPTGNQGGPDEGTYIAFDRTSKGQTFTTGGNGGGYTLTDIKIQHVGYLSRTDSGTLWRVDPGDLFDFGVGTVDRAGGFSLTQLHSETVTNTSGAWQKPGGLNYLGTGSWVAITLDTPQILSPNTEYYFEIISAGGGPYFETNGTIADPYPGGNAFRGNDDAGLDPGNAVESNGDMVFIAGLTPIGGLDVSTPTQLPSTLSNSSPVQRIVGITSLETVDSIQISSVTPGGPDAAAFSVDSFPASLAAGASGDILLTFTPPAVGTREMSLLITYDAGGGSTMTVDLTIEVELELEPGVTFRVYQANVPLTEMPALGSDQTPNIDEARPTINYKDVDKDGVADVGSDDGFGTIPPLERLEHIYCEAIGLLEIDIPGDYEFRLTADDGAELFVDGEEVIGNSDGERGAAVAATSAPLTLSQGAHAVFVRFWSGAGSPCLVLEWQKPGNPVWEVIAAHDAVSNPGGLRTEVATRVVSPGDKFVYFPGQGQTSGELTEVHPGYGIFTFAGDYGTAYPGAGIPSPPDLLIEGTGLVYRPRVGAIGFLPDGRLVHTSFVPPSIGVGQPATPEGVRDDKMYALSGVAGDDLGAVTVREVAAGLNQPTGLCVVGADVYVCEQNKLVRLHDANSDGDFLDPGEEVTILDVGEGWISNNYHQFTFGPVHQDGYLYGTLSTAITHDTGYNGPNTQHRGTWFRVSLTPDGGGDYPVEYLAGGLRTPNGLAIGPEGKQFFTDNQGSWNPASSLCELTPGHFYGHYNRWSESDGLGNPDRQPSAFWDEPLYWDGTETPVYANPYHGGRRRYTRPAVYLPQNELMNSPTEPVMIGDQHPSFKGQMFIAELTKGGIRRVFLEKIGGRFQGAAFRFTQGMVAGNERLVWGPDGSLYAGGMGSAGNWSWRGTTHGLQRLTPNGFDAFEIRTLRAVDGGFILTMTKPVETTVFEDLANYLTVNTWDYDGDMTYNYGGIKTGQANLVVTGADALPDGRSARLTIPGLIAGTVVHLRLDDPFRSSTGESLWSGEAYYTLNALPSAFESAYADWVTKHFPGSADLTVTGLTEDPDDDEWDNLSEFLSGGDPNSGAGVRGVSVSRSGGVTRIVSRQLDPLPAPLQLGWESSVNLSDWQSIELVPTGSLPLGNGVSEITLGAAPDSPAEDLFESSETLFIRRVSALPQP